MPISSETQNLLRELAAHGGCRWLLKHENPLPKAAIDEAKEFNLIVRAAKGWWPRQRGWRLTTSGWLLAGYSPPRSLLFKIGHFLAGLMPDLKPPQ